MCGGRWVMVREITEDITLADVAKLFPSYEITRIWNTKIGIEYADGQFRGTTSWHYRARKRFASGLKPVEAASMFELIGKITCGAEAFSLGTVEEEEE